MPSGLDSLTKNLVSSGKRLFGFEDSSELQYDLLTRNAVYPCEYVNPKQAGGAESAHRLVLPSTVLKEQAVGS